MDKLGVLAKYLVLYGMEKGTIKVPETQKARMEILLKGASNVKAR